MDINTGTILVSLIVYIAVGNYAGLRGANAGLEHRFDKVLAMARQAFMGKI